MKILIVEDDAIISDAIDRSLERAGVPAEIVATLADARYALSLQDFSMVVLDLGLPDGDGLKLLSEARRSEDSTPVLVLSARDEPRQRVLGLDSGADDYLIKPFDMGELIARIRVLMRRREGRAKPIIEYGRLTLDPAEASARLDGVLVDLTLRQLRLLQHLLERQGRVRTKQQIIEALYRWDANVSENTIEVYVSQLRKKLWPTIIRTMRGIGYSIPRLEKAPSADG